MILDSIWLGGEVLAIVVLMAGAYFVLMGAKPFSSLFGRKSAAPLPVPAEDLRSSERLSRNGSDDHARCGNGLMDAQHQGLLDDTNGLRAAILSGRPVDEVRAAIDALMRDLLQHFQDEEAILAAANYPGTAKHAALHRELLNSAATLVGQFRAGASSIGELFRFLAHNILAKHMVGADREFILYAANRR